MKNKYKITIKPGGPVRIRWAELKEHSPGVLVLSMDSDSKHYELGHCGALYSAGMKEVIHRLGFTANEGTGNVRKSKQAYTEVSIAGIPTDWHLILPQGGRYGYMAVFINLDKMEDFKVLARKRQR